MDRWITPFLHTYLDSYGYIKDSLRKAPGFIYPIWVGFPPSLRKNLNLVGGFNPVETY